MSDTPTPGPSEDGEQEGLGALVDEYVGRLRAGEAIDLEAIARRDPERARRLRRLLPTLEKLADLGRSAGPGDGRGSPPTSGGPASGTLGDYEIVREVGRGGMGVVYEARQVSLGLRRVALKVLPVAAAVEPRLVQRFHVEAQAAGLLRHPHIVPVYGVGSERGVHYYAMQFIEGRTLAELIAGLRQLRRGPATGPGSADADFALASRLASGLFVPEGDAGGDPVPSIVSARLDDTGPAGREPPPSSPGSATGLPARAPEFFRAAARLGIQAAEALDHAHERGVVHRDVKPANLMVDERGTLWVADFGVARLQEDSELTLTGDVIGTLRYMSPEQALGRPAVVDHRTDVYSLGATLYELLTLEPAVRGGDRREVQRRLVEEEPRPARRLNPAVPADLETIVAKAMAKEARDRYGSARELADDLRRFLEHRPIMARPPTPLDRAAKWARRRPAMAALVLVSVVASLALAWAITGWAYSSRLHEALRRAERAQRAEAEARQRERRLQYYHHVALAHGAWRDGDLRQVHQLLDGCPAEHRHWEWHYLERLCHGDLMTLRGHASVVLGVAVSPDGARLASAGNDRVIRVWDAATGRGVLTLEGHARGVSSVAYSPDGGRLVSAGGDGTARVWDARTGRQLVEFQGHALPVRAAAFHPDGSRVASAGEDQAVRVWDARTGREIRALRVPDVLVWGVAFSPDGTRLASAGSDGAVILWDAAEGRRIRALAGHTGMARAVAFSPDGSRLASAGADRTIRVWDAATGRQELVLGGHSSGVNGIAFRPDGARLASAGADGSVRVWDVGVGADVVRREVLTLKGHLSSVLGVAFSPDGDRLASAGADQAIKVWSARAAPEPMTLASGGRAAPAVAISPDGTCLASAGDDGVARVWEVATGRMIRALAGHSKDGLAKPISALAYSPGGDRLASGGWDDVVRVWDAATGRETHRLRGHLRGVTCVAFDPGGTRVASGSGDRTVRVWDLATGRAAFALGGYAGEVAGVAFSPDGRWLVVAGEHRPVGVYDARTGAELFALEGSGGDITSLAFSADGKKLAAGAWDQTVKVWDVGTWRVAAVLRGHTEGVLGVAFSPDGARLASAGADHAVKVWDVAAGREALTLRGHENRVHGVAFSPDGGRLASAGADGVVTIWDGRPWSPAAPPGGSAPMRPGAEMRRRAPPESAP